MSDSTAPAASPQRLTLWKQWQAARPAWHTLAWCLGLYALSMLLLLLFASRGLLGAHTPYNHFAHLAQGWLEGRLDLGGPPPGYARNNDFAKYGDSWFVAFPPFPAVLLLPLVALAGEPELVRDGQFFLWLAGLFPVLLFLALERLSQVRLSTRTRWHNALLAWLACFGTVFFFTAEQGTVWFAAHVVGVCLAAVYLFCCVQARHPVWAGLMLGLGSLTRTPLLFAVPLFFVESLRVSWRAPEGSGLPRSWQQARQALDFARCLRLNALFALPVALCLGFTFWYNHARFEDAFESGYRYLTVAWAARMEKWGLFDYHYLSRNLGVVLSMLPWGGNGDVPFRINVHGLALWFTTPLYFWLLWPKVTSGLDAAQRAEQQQRRWWMWGLWLTVACVATPTLFYQNTGWSQFGYRFSNDYVVFLFALLALGGRPLRALFILAALWGVTVNAFGAWTFGRADYKDYYYVDPSQTKFYERD